MIGYIFMWAKFSFFRHNNNQAKQRFHVTGYFCPLLYAQLEMTIHT